MNGDTKGSVSNAQGWSHQIAKSLQRNEDLFLLLLVKKASTLLTIIMINNYDYSENYVLILHMIYNGTQESSN